MDALFDKLKEEESIKEVLISSKFYSSSLENLNFNSFSDLNVFDGDVSSVWIDGGNSEIFGSPSYSYQKVRVVGIFWCGKSSVLTRKLDVECFIDSDLKIVVESDDELVKSVVGILNSSELVANVGQVKTPGDMVDILRRCLEIRLLNVMMNEGDVCFGVLDGNLIASTNYEETLLKGLVGKNVFAVSKSSNIATTGMSIFSELDKRANIKGDVGSWFVEDVLVPKSNFIFGKVLFSKLHKKSKLILKIDYLGGDDFINNLGEIERLSKDPVFLGYPYPLVKVDQLARVSNEEIEFFKTKILVRAKEKGLKLESEDLQKSGHSILDSIRF